MTNVHYSASQINNFRDCPRKWVLDSIEKVPRKKNEQAEIGTAVHTILEDYLGGGKPIDTETWYGKIIAPGIKHLPPPKSGKAETKFSMELPGLGDLIGYIDYQHEEEGVPINIDHKTTGDFKWALDEESLKEDTQSVIYAVYRLEATGADEVINRWIYYRRHKSRFGSKKVEAVMRLSEVDKQWQGVLASIKEMKAIRDSGVKSADAPYTAEACGKYGGCPYKGIACKLSAVERLRSYTVGLSIKEKLAARRANKAEAKTEDAGAAINPPAKAAPARRIQPDRRAEEERVPAGDMRYGYTLYLDCAPIKGNGQVLMFADLIAPVLSALQKEYGVAHYRLIKDLFGGAPAVFSTALQARIEASPLLGGVAMSSGSIEAQDALEVMIANAAVVIRG